MLRKGGVFLCVDDRPGVNAGTEYDNSLYNRIVNRMYRRYCFSDQSCVPVELHGEVIECLIAGFRQRYGDSFSGIAYKGVESDLTITIYEK